MQRAHVTVAVFVCIVLGSSCSGRAPAAASPSDTGLVSRPQGESSLPREINLESTDAWNRAAALTLQERYAEAVEAFSALAAAHPGSSAAHREHALALAQTGNMEAALEMAKRAVAVGPEEAGAHYIHGWILVEHQRYEDAIASLRRARDLNSTFPDIHFELGRTLGIVAGEKDERPARVEEAIGHVQQAIRLDTTKANYYDELGNLLGMSWRFAEAVAALRIAVQRAPTDADIRHNLAGQEVNAGFFEEAVLSFEQALRLDPARLQRQRFRECFEAAKAKRHC